MQTARRFRKAPARACARAGDLAERGEVLLADADGALTASAVHEVRVLCKRLRAFWQLLTPALGRDRTRALELPLRDVANALAGQREALVLQQAIVRLRRRRVRHASAERAAESRALDLLEELARARFPSHSPARDGGIGAIEDQVFVAQGAAIRSCALAADDADLLRGLSRTWRRARSEGRRGAILADDEAWHRCRKWIKYELYQMDLVTGGAPRRGRERRLARLGESLGLFHDLCDLRAFVDAQAPVLAREHADLHLARLCAREVRILRAEFERGFVRCYAGSDHDHARRCRRRLSQR